MGSGQSQGFVQDKFRTGLGQDQDLFGTDLVPFSGQVWDLFGTISSPVWDKFRTGLDSFRDWLLLITPNNHILSE